MFGSIKINKKIIFSLIIVLILIAGGVFYWWQKNRETPIEKWEAAKVSPEEDYIIKETPEGKIVENKKMGLIYEIPKDWILENGNPTRFYSSDTKFKGDTSVILEKGCKTYVYTSYIKTNIETLKNHNDAELKLSSVIKLDEFSTIKVDNYPALRYKFHAEKFEMSYIGIGIPSKDKLYDIKISNPTNEMERCEEEFNKFLETVSIKP
jgi:hypothetical protein